MNMQFHYHRLAAFLPAFMLAAGAPPRAWSWDQSALKRYDPPREVFFDRGYKVVNQPAASAAVLKEMPAGSAVIAAYLDAGGRRYFMTDWSYDRHVQGGHAPNWILPANGSAPAAPSNDMKARAQPAGGPEIQEMEIRQLEETGGYSVMLEPKRIFVKAGATLRVTFSVAEKNHHPRNLVFFRHPRVSEFNGYFQQRFNDPKFTLNDCIPTDPDFVRKWLIAYTKLVQPGTRHTIEFKAPREPGAYAFTSTGIGLMLLLPGGEIVVQ